MTRPKPRSPIWQSIARSLTGDIGSGRYGPGDKLPTEAALSAKFGVNRHTVRRALGELAAKGLVYARRGAGVYVAQRPTDYPIGRRVRYHQSLAAQGRSPAKTVLGVEERGADLREAQALELTRGDPVIAYEGLSLADDQVIAMFRSVFPKQRVPGLAARLAEGGSVTEALRQEGVNDYVRVSTRVNAKTATIPQTLHLRVPEGAPLLRTVGINCTPDGRPLEFGTSWFVGDLVTLTLGEEGAARVE